MANVRKCIGISWHDMGEDWINFQSRLLKARIDLNSHGLVNFLKKCKFILIPQTLIDVSYKSWYILFRDLIFFAYHPQFLSSILSSLPPTIVILLSFSFSDLNQGSVVSAVLQQGATREIYGRTQSSLQYRLLCPQSYKMWIEWAIDLYES
jgi:hypothetical protein